MTKLSENDVKHVASLANLQLTGDEITKFQKQLAKVVAHINQLQEINTSQIEPTSTTTGLENVRRQDEIKSENSLSNTEAVSGKDDTINGYFQVEAILKERGAK